MGSRAMSVPNAGATAFSAARDPLAAAAGSSLRSRSGPPAAGRPVGSAGPVGIVALPLPQGDSERLGQRSAHGPEPPSATLGAVDRSRSRRPGLRTPAGASDRAASATSVRRCSMRREERRPHEHTSGATCDNPVGGRRHGPRYRHRHGSITPDYLYHVHVHVPVGLRPTLPRSPQLRQEPG